MESIAKKACTGCHACYSICPQGCISMIADEAGFLYPKIEQKRCNDCRACQQVCPLLGQPPHGLPGRAFACINKDEQIRAKSSSGGMFTLLAEEILRQGGVVFGAAFDESWNICHLGVEQAADLEKLRGSKYPQSRIGNSYKEARQLLETGVTVLFSGTPCQISGLKSFLGRDYQNLILQDIICYGVPAPAVWQTYLRFRKAKPGAARPSFRHKGQGWKRFSLVIPGEGGREHSATWNKDPFMQVFLNNLCLRHSCYDCQAKGLTRLGDLTLADFWGVWQLAPEMFDDKGTSLVLVNSKKGQRLFEAVAGQMLAREVDYAQAISYNPAALRSAPLPREKREKFLARVNEENFEALAAKLTKKPLRQRIRRKAKALWRKMGRNN